MVEENSFTFYDGIRKLEMFPHLFQGDRGP